MSAPAELIRKIRRIEITTRRAVLDTLAGGYHSVFKGRGMAFSEVRPYQPGDEIRAIDWNVTARMGDPYVKVFAEVRAFKPKQRGTDLTQALGHLTRVQRRRAVVFVVSDFLADGYEGALAVAARRHDVVPVVISDPIEEELPLQGLSGLWPVTDA